MTEVHEYWGRVRETVSVAYMNAVSDYVRWLKKITEYLKQPAFRSTPKLVLSEYEAEM